MNESFHADSPDPDRLPGPEPEVEESFEPGPVRPTPEACPQPPPEARRGPATLQRLDPRQVDAQRIEFWIALGFLGTGSAVSWLLVFLFADPAPIGHVIFGAAFLSIVVGLTLGARKWPPLAWRHTSYRADGNGLELRRGVWWKSVTTVPRTRIQHTDVTQGPLQRRFTLATLVLHTAGTENSVVQLEGVTRETALALRDALVDTADGDDAV